MPIGGLGLGLGLNLNAVPLWLRLIQEAESAAAAAGASLWYVPPAGYADRAINGPFVGSDGSGGVPAVGSGVVGWLRDGSAGPVASPNILSNGDFSNGTTGWAGTGSATLSTVAEQLVITFAGGGGDARQVFTTVVGRVYRVTLDAVSFTASGNRFVLIDNFPSGVNVATVPLGAPGPVNFFFTAQTTQSRIFLFAASPSAGQTMVFDSISIREIPGAHATQSTSANRPILVAAPGAAAAAAGLGAPSFDGVNDLLATASLGVQSAETLIVAARWDRTAGLNDMFSKVSIPNSNGCLIRVEDGALVAYKRTTAPAWVSASAGAYSAGTPVVATLQAQNSGIFWVNGAQVGTIAGTYDSASAPVQIGNAFSATFAQGVCGLACYAPTTLTAAQRIAIERLGAFIVGAPYPGL